MNPRILVVSSHPAVDVEWRVARVLPEEKNLILEERRWPGGKGINVARWLKWLGAEPIILLPIGGDTGQELVRGLVAEGIEFLGVPIGEPNRANVVVSQEKGPQYRFNAIRPRLSRTEANAFASAFQTLAQTASLIVISGTLAPGLPTNYYGQLIRQAVTDGSQVVLDCDGAAFEKALGAHPFLVKPNEFELSEWVGKPLRSEKSLRDAAFELSRKTRGWVMVSRGAKGALLANADESVCFTQDAEKVTVRNSVGAGDAMVAAAAYALAGGQSPAEWLDSSLKTAAQLVRLPPGTLPRPKRRK
ncbi:MAG TPA: hexose kinase [Candidatus Limnocylindria bacterium]|nr:hexose kinase [Candidatus Limnocylindria bacterium]